MEVCITPSIGLDLRSATIPFHLQGSPPVIWIIRYNVRGWNFLIASAIRGGWHVYRSTAIVSPWFLFLFFWLGTDNIYAARFIFPSTSLISRLATVWVVNEESIARTDLISWHGICVEIFCQKASDMSDIRPSGWRYNHAYITNIARTASVSGSSLKILTNKSSTLFPCSSRISNVWYQVFKLNLWHGCKYFL